MEFKLRKFNIGDINALAKHANNIKIAQFMTDTFPHPYGRPEAEAFISSLENSQNINAIDTGEVIGAIGHFPQQGIMRKNVELGYWLSEEYWGKGIMTKAINQTVKHIFSRYDIHRIYARPFGTNIASQKVLEKCGFEREAHFKKTIYKNGEFHDEIVYAIRNPKND